MRNAALTSAVALLLTVLAVAAEIVEGMDRTDRMRLLLTSEGTATVVASCAWPAAPRYVEGELADNAFGAPFVDVGDVRGVYGRAGGTPVRTCESAPDLRLPRSQIRAAFKPPAS